MRTKDEEAKALAEVHYQAEVGLTHVFRVTGDGASESAPSEPIKLLEVNRGTVPSGILPLHFGPSPASGLTYPTIIMEVTPEEFHRIEAQDLKLPNGWRLGHLIPRSTTEARL